MVTKFIVFLPNGGTEPIWVVEGDMAPRGGGLRPETVDTVFGGKTVTLAFVPQDDVTAKEIYLAARVARSGVAGSEMAFIMQHNLLRHFYEMPEKPQPKPAPLKDEFESLLAVMDQAYTPVITPSITRMNHEYPPRTCLGIDLYDDAIVGAAETEEMKRALTATLAKIREVQHDKEMEHRYNTAREKLLKAEEAAMLVNLKRTRDRNDTGR